MLGLQGPFGALRPLGSQVSNPVCICIYMAFPILITHLVGRQLWVMEGLFTSRA